MPDEELRREFLPALFEPFRPNASDFTPLLNELTPDEVERNDKEREREVRRKRRQTKGRGVTLPDRDPVKTHRTLVPKSSNAPMHAYQDSRGEMVYPMPEMNLPYPIVRPVLEGKPPVVDDPLDDPTSSKLAASKGNVLIPPGAEKGGGARLKRLKNGDSGASTPGGDASRGGRAGSPTATTSNHPPVRKKPPVVRPAVEELGLHEHIIDGHWFCANWFVLLSPTEYVCLC